MAEILTEALVRGVGVPGKGNRITYDADVKGFGVRVTYAGAKSFILNYRVGGQERRCTIGSHPDWTVKAAREEAKLLKRRIDVGENPMAERHAERAAPTMAQLADLFASEHLPTLRPKTCADYATILRKYVRPALGKRRVADLGREEVKRLHAGIAALHLHQANRVLSVLSRMMGLAVEAGMRADNPLAKLARPPEPERERDLSEQEIKRLGKALDGLPRRSSANALRLILRTGARKREVLGMRWRELDPEAEAWTKLGHRVKNNTKHVVPLSDAALALLGDMRSQAVKAGTAAPDDFLFPGVDGKPQDDIKGSWTTVCREAGLGGLVTRTGPQGKSVRIWKSDTRPHDLRHHFGSVLASNNYSLLIIGKLLGHKRTRSTERYARHVHRAGCPGEALHFGVPAEVGGQDFDPDLVLAAQRIRRGLQRRAVAGGKQQVAPFLRQDTCRSRTDALAAAGDERSFAS